MARCVEVMVAHILRPALSSRFGLWPLNNDDDTDKQDPVSTMQKTELTNYSSFLVWCGLEKGFNYGCGH